MTDRFFSPRNTTNAMQDDAERLLFLADSWGRGPGNFIEAQEAAGQREFVNSDVIPTDTRGTSEQELEALGFKLGPVVDGDPMFRRANLPDGWTREGSEHAMWSYLLDNLGRRRCSIFYKASWYDRSAHLSVASLSSYLREVVFGAAQLVLDDEWASPTAVTAALTELRAYADEQATYWANHANQEYGQERARAYRDEIAKYDALAAEVAR